MSDIPQSPQHRPRRPEASTSWTLGNSGNITSPMVENSPRSILKEAKTPDIFKVSDVNRSQAERYDDLLSRRVSFASATRVRVYGKNETPNSPSHRTMNQRLSTSSPEGSNALFDDPTSHSPSNRSNNAFLSRLSGSPMDRRKRRRDMFGSPPSQRSTNQPSVVYPEFRFRGMRDLVDEDDDDEGPRHNALFTQVLSQGEQQGRKRLFDDEDDTNIGINNNNNNNNNNTGNIPLGSPNSKTGRFSIVSYNDDNTDAMNIVLQDTTNNIEQTGTSFADTMDLKWNPTNDTTQGMEPISSTQGSLQPLPQTQESDDTNIVSSYTPFKQSSYGITNQPSSQKASQGSSIKFTQDSPVMDRPQVSPHNNKFGTLYNNATKATYAFNTSSPTHSPLHSPLRSPSRSTTLNHDSLSIKSPRVGMSVLESMDASPILPIRSPLRTLSSKQQSHHDSPSDGFSPRRSFYLHDKAQTHSPLVTNDDNDDGDNNNTPSRFTKSPLRHEQFAGKNLSEHSIGSDYGDRMVSLHGSENFNIFEEELPELYDSFDGDSSSSPKPMSLSHFLKSAAGFNSNPTTPRRPKQIPQVDYPPPTYDEQATAGATTIVEMDVYDKLVKQTEGLVHDLTTRFQQLDEDLSQNNPQVFAEYNNATPIMFTQMESRFHDLRKLAYVEAKQKWYNMYISAMETLADHFQKQQENQHKDQELLKQRTAYLVKNLPSVSEELNVIKKAVEEAKKKVKMYEQIDQGLLERWERDIKDQEAVITKSQKETEEAKEKEEKALEKLSLLAQKKAELKLAISQAEATKNAHSYVSELDVIRARDAFESCSGLCAWKLEKKTDDTIQYIIFDEVDVLLDTNKLKNHDVDAVFIRMLESRDLEYGPFAELVHGLQVTAKGIWSQEKILQDISIYWNRVRLIRDEINKVKRRFWIEIEPLTPDSVTDIELRGFRCNITIFSYMLKIKFLVSFEIRAEQVMAYPQSIDLSTLQVDFKYGDTTPEYLDTLVRIKFKENGIIGLLDTLCSIIDDFQ